MKKVLTLFCGVFLCLSLSAMTANEIDESGTVYRKGSKKNITITNATTINGNASYLVGESCTTAIQLTRGSYSQNPINLEEAGFSGIRPTECTDSSTEIRDAWYKATSDEIGSLHFIISSPAFDSIAVGYAIYSDCQSGLQQCASIPEVGGRIINAVILPPNRVPNKEWYIQVWSYANQNQTITVRAVKECGVTKATLSEPICVDDTTFKQEIILEHFNVSPTAKLFAEYYTSGNHGNVIVNVAESPQTLILSGLDPSAETIDLRLAATGECELTQYHSNIPIPNCVHGSNCPQNLTVSDTIIGDFQAANTISTNGTITLAAATTFIAGTSITLNSGFHARKNVDFLAKIATCSETEQIAAIATKRTVSTEITAIQPENQMKIYPNPFNYTTTIDYQMKTSGIVAINLYDISGKALRQLVAGHQEKGNYQITLSTDDLPSGLYFVRARLKDEIKVEKIYLLK